MNPKGTTVEPMGMEPMRMDPLSISLHSDGPAFAAPALSARIEFRVLIYPPQGPCTQGFRVWV